MKKTSIFLSIIIAVACSNDTETVNTNELVGTWQLTEQLADPGDGSGEFKPVNSDKTIKFFPNGTFIANSPLCYMDATSEQNSSGVYDTAKMVLIPDNCQIGSSNSQLELSYKLEDPNLILYFPCIEPCAEKYVKIE